MPHNPDRFVLLLDEYIGFIGDLPPEGEFDGHFILEDKINAEGKALGFTPIFVRTENWQLPDGGSRFTVPVNASDEVWNKIEKTFGDIDAKGYKCEIELTVSRPHQIGHTTYHDLPLRGFRNNDNFPCADRQKLIAMLREWQRAARTDSVESAAPTSLEEELPATGVEDLVNLDEAAAIVHRSKKTLERYLSKMPAAYVQGGGGKPSLWKWAELRPWLEKQFVPDLPKRFPRNVR
jgi:hypothetical protein